VSVRIGYMPSTFGSCAEGVALFRKLVSVGDQYGYDSIWMSDRMVSSEHIPDPLISLAMVAAYSERLKFGTSVLQLPLRNPVVLAKEIATLDFLSGGRFLPAVGLGQEDPKEYETFGIRKEERAERTDEALILMRRLWHEESVTYHGKFYSVSQASINPKPIQEPFLPIWVGGRSKAAQRRVGRLGDGWLASSVLPKEVEDGIKVIFSTAEQCSRYIESDHIGVIVGFRITKDKRTATELAKSHILRQRSQAHFTEYSALGTPSQVISVIQSYIRAGASKFVMRPLCSADQAIGQLEMLGKEVVPYFHR